MCLDILTDVGYKVVKVSYKKGRDALGRYTGKRVIDEVFLGPNQGSKILFPKDVWLTSNADHVTSPPYAKPASNKDGTAAVSYPLGFHLLPTREAAESYSGYDSATIVPVQFKEILAIGYQNRIPVIVANKILRTGDPS